MFAFRLEVLSKFLKPQKSVAVVVLVDTIDQGLYIWIVVQFELGADKQATSLYLTEHSLNLCSREEISV